MNEVDQHICKKYNIEKRLGKGAYGIVWKGKSKRSGRVVAIKKIFDAFRNRTDAQRTFREIVFLKEFSEHPNIIKLLNVHRAGNDKDLYLIFEYMNTDLHHVIRKGNILKDIHKKFIMYQLLKATKYLHSGNVIHRDQKPSNILLDAECNCKIADFGLARSLRAATADDPEECLTDYVATRWYRAPEILLGSQHYTKGVDTWSLGCILGEMLIGRPLFPGKSTIDQIERITTLVAFDSKKDPSSFNYSVSSYARDILEKASSKFQRGALDDKLRDVQDEHAVDLLKKLLVLIPDKRITAHEALYHPYVAKFHNEKYEKSLESDVVPPLSDNVQLSVNQYREKLYELIQYEKIKSSIQQREEDPLKETTSSGDKKITHQVHESHK